MYFNVCQISKTVQFIKKGATVRIGPWLPPKTFFIHPNPVALFFCIERIKVGPI